LVRFSAASKLFLTVLHARQVTAGPSCLKRFTMSPDPKAEPAAKLFMPSKRAAGIIAFLGFAAVSAALFLRYSIIQNSEIGVACEAGEKSLVCSLRLGAIRLFVQGLFGWIALLAAGFQLWRPNVLIFGMGIVFALFGLVLYNTRVSALAVALLLLSLARPSREGR
jgi:hypothetical protein